jgi:hypothetical protein
MYWFFLIFLFGQLLWLKIIFVGQCSRNIDNGETRECTVDGYVVSRDEVPSISNGIDILFSNIETSLQQQIQLFTDEMRKIK